MEKNNLFKRLSIMRQKIKITKTGRNNFGNYDYYELDEICAKSKDIFAEYGVFNYSQMHELSNVDGDFVGFKLSMFVVNADDPLEFIELIVSSEKASMKGAQAPQEAGAVRTYLYKYAMLDLLLCDDGTDDPDKNNKHEKVKKHTQKTLKKETTGADFLDRDSMIALIEMLPDKDQKDLKKKFKLKDTHNWKFTKGDLLKEIYKEVGND